MTRVVNRVEGEPEGLPGSQPRQEVLVRLEFERLERPGRGRVVRHQAEIRYFRPGNAALSSEPPPIFLGRPMTAKPCNPTQHGKGQNRHFLRLMLFLLHQTIPKKPS